MRFETLALGPYRANCYLLWNEDRDALLVDPGDEGGVIESSIAANGLCVRAILITHAHLDHVGAAARLQAHCGAPVWMHGDDEPLFAADRPRSGFCTMADGEILGTEPFTVQAITLPGHSPGSVGYYLPEQSVLLTGDTLFRGMVGNTEGVGADSALLGVSLRKLLRFPPETRVLPGHGTSTTLERERRANYAIAAQQLERSFS